MGLGVRNVLEFQFFDQKGPTRKGLVRSLDLLYNLGAIDETGSLTTETGLTLVELSSLDARSAAAVLIANKDEYRVGKEMLVIACLMQFN